MISKRLALLPVALLAMALPTYATIIIPASGDYVYTGDTTDPGDTFNRLEANGANVPNALSSDGDDVDYTAISFQVASTGVYSMTVDTSLMWNSYLFLYQNSFDPSHPLDNVLLGDSNPDTTSSLVTTLVSGTRYIDVITGFSDFADSGPFTLTFSSVTPEPSSALLIAGLLPAIAWARKRVRR